MPRRLVVVAVWMVLEWPMVMMCHFSSAGEETWVLGDLLQEGCLMPREAMVRDSHSRFHFPISLVENDLLGST